MADRDRDERRRRVVDAGRRVSEHSSGDRQSLNIPQGLGLWLPKKPGAYRIEVLAFEVGKAAEKFSLRKYADVGDLYYERTYFNHARIGVNNDSYVCPAKTFGKPCPICEHRGQLAKSPRKEDEELVYALKPKERQLFLIVDHDEEQKGVQLWEVSFHNFGKHLDAKINNADDEDRVRYRRFADPEEGLTLKLAASEESAGGGKYLEFAVDEFRPRKEKLDPDWIEHGFCLDDVVRMVSYDELKKIFLQTGDEDEKETGNRRASRDEDDPPPRDPPPAKKRPPEDDDDPPPRKREPEPPARREWTKDNVGDEVAFEYKDKWWTGTLIKVDSTREVGHVDIEGRDKPQIVDLDEIQPVAKAKKKATSPEDDDPPPAEKSPPADADDDPPPRKRPAPPEDDDPPPRKKREPEPDPPEKTARKKPATDWDDDDKPFKKK